jgi:lipoprotein
MKFAKSTLVAAMVAIGLSACTSKEEAVAKVQQEGVIDFQDGWKLYLENTSDPKYARIVRQDGPVYVYSENDNPLFIYTCGDVNQPTEIGFFSDIGEGTGLAKPGQTGEVLGIKIVYGIYPDAFANEVEGKSREQITADNTLLRDQDLRYVPVKSQRISFSTDSLVPDSIPFKLADGFEYTIIQSRPEFIDIYRKVNAAVGVPSITTGTVAMASLYSGLPNHQYRAFKLPAIQNPGLYNGSVCNFTWDKFDPRDISSKSHSASVWSEEEIAKSESRYQATAEKALPTIISEVREKEKAYSQEPQPTVVQDDITTAYTDPNAAKVESDGTVTREYSGSYSQIYASKAMRGDWAPADNSDAAQGRSMYGLCHVSENQNACKRLENRCGKDEYVKTESDMYFCLGAAEAEYNEQSTR